MKKYEDYVEEFKEYSMQNYRAMPWEYKIINKNHAKMRNIVKKIFEMNEQDRFFEEMFSSEESGIRQWAACFSEIFNYDLVRAYEVFANVSKEKNPRPTDVTGAKIAMERLAEKIRNMQRGE